MKALTYIFISILFVHIFYNCSGFQAEHEIPYNFEFKEQVFIMGLLTNESGLVSLDIQKSIPADSTGFDPINNAQVYLYTKNGHEPELITDDFTIENGKYTSAEILNSIEGNSYWAEIILEDGTILKSEEEILKSPIGLSITDFDDVIHINIEDPNDEENFYLIYTEIYNGDDLLFDTWSLIDDINDDSEMYLVFSNQEEGVTLKMNLYNINFNTFQFYYNTLPQLENELDIFFPPLNNLYGNITNIETNKLVLGNFGIAGYSHIVKEF